MFVSHAHFAVLTLNSLHHPCETPSSASFELTGHISNEVTVLAFVSACWCCRLLTLHLHDRTRPHTCTGGLLVSRFSFSLE